MAENTINSAVELLARADCCLVFTGAGISVESGIPPFRGREGLWSRYDPNSLEYGFFLRHPEQSWPVIKEVFYRYFDCADPNDAHLGISRLEKAGIVNAVITQNIDGLHQKAGSDKVIEFHGSSRTLSCMDCGMRYQQAEVDFEQAVPCCAECSGVLKPDFIFFGEGIPPAAYAESLAAAEACDVILVVGTTGEVMPACTIPRLAKQRGAAVIEVNTQASNFTSGITDVFLEGKAAATVGELSTRVLEMHKEEHAGG